MSRIARRALLAGLGAMLAAPRWAAARAPQPELAAWLPGARLQGQARMSFIGLAVYDIRLWVSDGFDARFLRIWEFYLAYCEAAFDTGNTDVVQFTLQRG